VGLSFVTGSLNDLLAPRHGDAAVRYPLQLIALVGGPASVRFWMGSGTLCEDLASRDA